MIRLAPSVYAADYIHLKQQLCEMEAHGVTQLHIDVMDGNFVPNLSFGPDFVANLRPHTKMALDVHLMIQEPIRFIGDFIKAGADSVTVHYEACSDLLEVLHVIERMGAEAGIALKPGTPLSVLGREILGRIRILQLMTVPPGLKGQHFLPESIGKIREARSILRRWNCHAQIEADGDITPEKVKQVIGAGADILVAGKGIFTGDLGEMLDCYQNLMRQAERGRNGQDGVFDWN